MTVTTIKETLDTLTLGRAEEVASGDRWMVARTLNDLRLLWNKAASQVDHKDCEACDHCCGYVQANHFPECENCPARDAVAPLIDEYLNR